MHLCSGKLHDIPKHRAQKAKWRFDTGIALIDGRESCGSPSSTRYRSKGKDKTDCVNSAPYHEDHSAIRNYCIRCEWALYIYTYTHTHTYIHSIAQHLLVGKGLLIIGALLSHSETSQSVGLLWTSDQPDAGTTKWQHTTLTRDRHPCTGGIRTLYRQAPYTAR
jgi:hypothetical protein